MGGVAVRKPPRPAPIVAAAVLLIVVGSELLLAGIGGSLWLFFNLGINGCAFCGVWLFAFGFLIGTHFLIIGIDALKGELVNPTRASNIVLAVGIALSLISLLSMCCCVRDWLLLAGFDLAELTQSNLQVFAGILLFWANSFGVLTAGVLFRDNVERYLLWREAIRRAPEDAGYELDGED